MKLSDILREDAADDIAGGIDYGGNIVKAAFNKVRDQKTDEFNKFKDQYNKMKSKDETAKKLQDKEDLAKEEKDRIEKELENMSATRLANAGAMGELLNLILSGEEPFNEDGSFKTDKFKLVEKKELNRLGAFVFHLRNKTVSFRSDFMVYLKSIKTPLPPNFPLNKVKEYLYSNKNQISEQDTLKTLRVKSTDSEHDKGAWQFFFKYVFKDKSEKAITELASIIKNTSEQQGVAKVKTAELQLKRLGAVIQLIINRLNLAKQAIQNMINQKNVDEPLGPENTLQKKLETAHKKLQDIQKEKDELLKNKT